MARKLAAVTAADVAEYSRRMEEDEAGTLAALRQLRQEILATVISESNGRIIKSMGDGWLFEHDSALDALTCAVAIQLAIRDTCPLTLRIGVHVGDIVSENEDIFGDGVNVAARLQENAQPGGIVASELAIRSAKGPITGEFRDGGSRTLKNIAADVHIFSWGAGAGENAKPNATASKPTILVLPFAVQARDEQLVWLADGCTEAVITGLSRFSWFLTLPSTTSMTLKDTVLGPADIRSRFNAHYALQAKIRGAGTRVRMNVELVDLKSERPIWSDQIDDSSEDPFAFEDRITRAILAELTPRLLDAEERRAKFGASEEAWDLVMQGRGLMWHVNEADIAKAQALFLKAIELEPQAGIAQTDLAQTYIFQRLYGWGGDMVETTARAVAAADAAVAADEHDAYALATSSEAKALSGQIENALPLAERAVHNNPYLPLGHAIVSLCLIQQEKYEEAEKAGNRALELSPQDPFRSIIRAISGIFLLMMENYDEMTANAEAMVREFPGMPTGYRQLAVAYARTGRREDARRVVEDDILRLLPGHTATLSAQGIPFGRNTAARERWIESLVAAGLPR